MVQERILGFFLDDKSECEVCTQSVSCNHTQENPYAIPFASVINVIEVQHLVSIREVALACWNAATVKATAFKLIYHHACEGELEE